MADILCGEIQLEGRLKNFFRRPFIDTFQTSRKICFKKQSNTETLNLNFPQYIINILVAASRQIHQQALAAVELFGAAQGVGQCV